MKNILLVIIFTLFLTTLDTNNTDTTTEDVCYQESLVDHKKYILPERWKDEWEDFDWYKSCIDNIREVSPIK